jgi:hypothetical protein
MKRRATEALLDRVPGVAVPDLGPVLDAEGLAEQHRCQAALDDPHVVARPVGSVLVGLHAARRDHKRHAVYAHVSNEPCFWPFDGEAVGCGGGVEYSPGIRTSDARRGSKSIFLALPCSPRKEMAWSMLRTGADNKNCININTLDYPHDHSGGSLPARLHSDESLGLAGQVRHLGLGEPLLVGLRKGQRGRTNKSGR